MALLQHTHTKKLKTNAIVFRVKLWEEHTVNVYMLNCLQYIQNLITLFNFLLDNFHAMNLFFKYYYYIRRNMQFNQQLICKSLKIAISLV